MAEAAGYVLNVGSGRRETLLEAHASDGIVAESVPEFAHSRTHPLVCFVSFSPGRITHLALGRRGHPAGTQLRRLNLRELTELAVPVEHRVVLGAIPNSVRAHVAARFESGGLLPPASFDAVVDAVRELAPDSGRLLNRFSSRRRNLVADLAESTRVALAYQKETVATAIDLAGLDRTDLQMWEPKGGAGTNSSFLDGLPQVRLLEDQMVINDLTNFPGFDLLQTRSCASAIFANRNVRLTVVLANKLPLETQLGADLIYCNDTFRSFVVVQYKAMEHEAGGVMFRLPNEQLAKELRRMDAAWSELQKCVADASMGGFRLMNNPFFVKLCPRVAFDPDDASLIKGMYLPLDYWRCLERDPIISGPREGKRITFENVGRYFSNTSFADLVAGGWIGTTTNQTSVLEAVIREVLQTGRTVTIAVKHQVGDDRSGRDSPGTDAADGARSPGDHAGRVT